MKLIYKGKFDGNPGSLPHAEHQPGAVMFKEFEDPKKMGIFANLLALALFLVFQTAFYLRSGSVAISVWGCLLSLLTLFPHEFLHAVCFKGEVCLYTNLKQGMLFVVGTEVMSKGRFIFMSLLPSLVFGFLPYVIAIIDPSLTFLGVFASLTIAMGAGDYYNVFNALTQMPRGAKTYLHQFHSYWYMPS